MEKATVRNRKRQKIAVLVEPGIPGRGLVFVMHGLGGFKEQPHMQMIAGVFRRFGYTVVRFDTTNSLGQSDGSYQYATVTNYYNDLEDVIAWAKKQPWYEEPFTLVAHNMGGMCVGLYAARFPERVRALGLVATIVSGALSMEALRLRENIDAWQATGWLVRESRSRPGFVKRLKWSHMEDRLRYDLLDHAKTLTMPVFLAVGARDAITPLSHQRLLYNAIPGTKELHVIPNAHHRFRDMINLQELSSTLCHWVEKLEVHRKHQSSAALARAFESVS